MGWDAIPADTLAEILPRVPPSARRRLRLVCRHWRGAVDERTPERRHRAKVLAFVGGGRGCLSRAYVFDDCRRLLDDGSSSSEKVKVWTVGTPKTNLRSLWTSGTDTGASMVGTCNGLLCLLREQGDIVVVNPATGDELSVPPPPLTPDRSQGAAMYSFAHHPETGQHKIVHVPRRRRKGTFGAVHVLTLGDCGSGGGASPWRAVPAPAGSSVFQDAGLASVGGATYWVTGDATRVVSFDLVDERVAFAEPLPVAVAPWALLLGHCKCRLADVCGRPGIAICGVVPEGTKTEVWVLEAELTWTRRSIVVVRGTKPIRGLASPHFAHGEYVLTTFPCRDWETGGGRWAMQVGAHRPREESMLQCGVVRIHVRMPEEAPGYSLRTFPYVETTEPLSV